MIRLGLINQRKKKKEKGKKKKEKIFAIDITPF